VDKADIIVRPVEWTDKDLVFSTWLRGQYWGSDYYSLMDQDQYFQDYAKKVTRYLTRPGTKVDCAVLKDSPEMVLGYIVYNNDHLFWTYVKRDYRKQGIMNLLLRDIKFKDYSGHTKAGVSIAKKKKLTFNPTQE